MANPTKANYPTELRLPNGEILKVAESPELKTFVEQTIVVAAGVEKDKLYATIEAEKAKVEEANKTIAKMNGEAKSWAETIVRQEQAHNDQQARLKAELERAAAEAAAQRTPEQLAEMMSNVFQQHLAPLREALTTTEQRTAELEKIRVETYLQSLRADLGDTVLPELVKGNTIEEINASVPMAKEMRQRYAPVVLENNTNNGAVPQTPQHVVPVTTNTQPVTGDVHNGSIIAPHTQSNPLLQTTPQQQAAQPPVTTPPAQPAAQPVVVPYIGTHQQPEVTNLPNIAAMSEKDFEKNRESLLSQLQGHFTGNGQ